MYKRYKERFGTVGVVLGVIALILALGGTALAAKGALTGKQKKEVEKIAKKYAGKPGAPGANGTNGAAGKDGVNGKDGAPGAKGEDGDDGAPGTPGTNGTDGKSVLSDPLDEGDEHCPAGGTQFEVEDSPPSYACNGSPWALGSELPSGATETGAWVASGTDTTVYTSLSFPVKLVLSLGEEEVHFQSEPSFSTTCAGNVQNPTAPAGHLCVYFNEFSIENTTFGGLFRYNKESTGAGRSGAILALTMTGTGFAAGSWAVTAS